MSDTQPIISVIVPIYKAEKYIRRCLDSIKAQTLKDFETILVDDGSPDDSGKICDEYAQKDSRFRVIHQTNGGVSRARQTGLDNATGEYVIHADPDDWMEPDMLQSLYDKAKETDADMVICDFYRDEKDGIVEIKQCPSKLDHDTVQRELFGHLMGSCWNKLVRRSLFTKLNIRFDPEIHMCEDLFINVQLLQHQIKISYIDKPLYHYDQSINVNSISHSTSIDFLNHLNFVFQKFNQLDLDLSCRKAMLRHQSHMIIYHAYNNDVLSDSEFRRLFGNYKYVFLKNETLPFSKRIIYFIACSFSLKSAKRLEKLYHKISSYI